MPRYEFKIERPTSMFGFQLNKLSFKKPVRNFWDHSADCDFKRFTGGDLEKSQRKLSHQKT